MKNKHRIKQGLSLLLAGGIALTNLGAALPAFAEEPPATPETAEAATPESAAPAEQPAASDGGLSVEEIQSRMYPSLPQTATGYYLDSNGLPVLTGETKISIEGWGDEDYRDYDADSTIQVALDEGLLNTDSATASFPRMDGEDYAIVPISMQVLYPANGGSADITLPDNVELLGYNFTSDDLCSATEEERQRQLHYDFSEGTASVAGIYVKATEDFSVTLTYTDSEKSLTKALHVTLDDSAPFPGILQDRFAQEAQPATCSADAGVAAYAGLQVTQCVYTSVGWMNYLGGQPALCADSGKWAWGPGATYANKYPPVANYSSAGSVWVLAEFFGKGWTADQATMWAQGFNSGAPSAVSTCAAEDATDNNAYLDRLAWQAEQFPDSLAGEIVNGTAVYADDDAETVYIGTLYVPSNAAWQRFVILDYTPVTLGGDNEIPELTPEGQPVDKPWSASYERTETLDFSYSINTDKIQLEMLEKVDGAGIDIAPILDGIPANINGGSWTITPAGNQSVTTGGHTQDDSYHLNGGDASATWTVHYSVSKSASQSGSVTANSEQDADAQASAAQSAAQSACESQVNGEIEAALSAVHGYFDSLKFSYDEVTIPHGFDSTPGALGSHQTITVPANSSNDYKMQNDEWSVKVSIDKIDSETKQRIKGDAEFKIFEWDTVQQCYIPAGGYNQYKVERQSDGTYKVINHSDYAGGSDDLFYTQRNEGKFVIVESRAPNGYYGDWTDVNTPGAAGSVLGKRAYAFEITNAQDGQTIWLGNADYNADISTTNSGGTLIDTGEGVVTITFGSRNADKTYATDPTGIANNDDSYTMHANADKMQNDRVLGNILLTKVDLDAARYLAAGSNGDTTLEGAVYDLYAADTIEHPDGVSGVVDYSKITDANGQPIWHTTVLTNGGWDTDYLPILQKDRLVASAKITDGKLAFANLYMGRYYLVERATGLVLPIDGNGKLYVTGKYPQLNKKLERTGKYSSLATKGGEYTDYIYKNQYSAVAESRKLNGSKAWDGYYLSYAKGYLCDEVNHYKTLTYADESAYHIHAEQESQDEVLKSGFSLNKLVSTTGQPSPALKLEGAGFTVYRISKLSKAAQFKQNPDGSYDAQSILDAYRKDNYDNLTLKYDFTHEGQAIANMFESNTDTVNAYNATLTADGDYANGRGNGWMPTDQPAEYRLGEMFTNDEGIFRVEGLPYGKYLVVETTIPKDVFQCDPFIVTVDTNSPQSRFTIPAGSVTTPSNDYMTFNVLDEELEGYLQLIKTDTETGKAVKIANTAFALYRLDEKDRKTRISMIDPASGSATKKTDVFYTDADGLMKTPEKLPLGRYLIEELQGPEGYYNDPAYSVEFEIKSDRVWQVVGNATNDMDEYIVTEKYCNHETLGQLTIRKLGNVLTDYQDGQFIYTQDNLAGAVYEIHAAADIATPDRQGTYWYKDGDLVVTVTTGAEGQVDEVKFSPTRTQATYDFLTVTHDGTKGEVTVALPLGMICVDQNGQAVEISVADQMWLDDAYFKEKQLRLGTDAPRAALAYRVSTKGQVDHDDIPMQKIDCRKFAQKQGWRVVKEVAEKGVSGSKVSASKRDAIQQLKEEAANGEFDILLVYMFDRLGRIESETPFVLEWFVQHGIEMWSTHEGQQKIETHGDKLMNYIRFWQAAGESEKTSIRTRDRIRQIVSSGHYTGGFVCYGYQLVDQGRRNKRDKPVMDLVINEEEATWVRELFYKVIQEGTSGYALAEMLNNRGLRTRAGAKFQSSNIIRIIRHEGYTGYIITKNARSEYIKELQIIDRETFDKANDIINRRKAKSEQERKIAHTSQNPTLLAGIVYCAHCGAKMSGFMHTDRYKLADGSIREKVQPMRGR